MVEAASEYAVLTVETLPAFLTTSCPKVVSERLKAPLVATEIGDGNLNLVFLVKGSDSGALIVKQALPYVRCVGEGWPLTKDRIYFEHEALVAMHGVCASHSPEIYHFDRDMSVIVMEYLAPPFQILRQALCAGQQFPQLADHLSTFLASTLFRSSALQLAGPAFRQAVGKWSQNHPLCALTEQVVFTDPYLDGVSPGQETAFPNAHNEALDAVVTEMRSDFELKLKVHGDLHTGSVMATADRTVVIDSEFAFYGPMGFDVGAIVANLLLAYCAAPGRPATDTAEFKLWLLQQVQRLWQEFERKFVTLWAGGGVSGSSDSSSGGNGDGSSSAAAGEAYSRKLFGGGGGSSSGSGIRMGGGSAPVSSAFAFAQGDYGSGGEYGRVQQHFMRALLVDAIGYAGCKMVRRVVGVAHVEDLDGIADPAIKATCEAAALATGRMLILHAADFGTIDAVVAAVQTGGFSVADYTEAMYS